MVAKFRLVIQTRSGDIEGWTRLQNRSAQLHALREKFEIALSIGDKSGGCVMRRRADDVGLWAGRGSGGGRHEVGRRRKVAEARLELMED